jgi:hypothetical protein
VVVKPFSSRKQRPVSDLRLLVSVKLCWKEVRDICDFEATMAMKTQNTRDEIMPTSGTISTGYWKLVMRMGMS